MSPDGHYASGPQRRQPFGEMQPWWWSSSGTSIPNRWKSVGKRSGEDDQVEGEERRAGVDLVSFRLLSALAAPLQKSSTV